MNDAQYIVNLEAAIDRQAAEHLASVMCLQRRVVALERDLRVMEVKLQRLKETGVRL